MSFRVAEHVDKLFSPLDNPYGGTKNRAFKSSLSLIIAPWLRALTDICGSSIVSELNDAIHELLDSIPGKKVGLLTSLLKATFRSIFASVEAVVSTKMDEQQLDFLVKGILLHLDSASELPLQAEAALRAELTSKFSSFVDFAIADEADEIVVGLEGDVVPDEVKTSITDLFRKYWSAIVGDTTPYPTAIDFILVERGSRNADFVITNQAREEGIKGQVVQSTIGCILQDATSLGSGWAVSAGHGFATREFKACAQVLQQHPTSAALQPDSVFGTDTASIQQYISTAQQSTNAVIGFTKVNSQPHPKPLSSPGPPSQVEVTSADFALLKVQGDGLSNIMSPAAGWIDASLPEQLLAANSPFVSTSPL